MKADLETLRGEREAFAATLAAEKAKAEAAAADAAAAGGGDA